MKGSIFDFQGISADIPESLLYEVTTTLHRRFMDGIKGHTQYTRNMVTMDVQEFMGLSEEEYGMYTGDNTARNHLFDDMCRQVMRERNGQ